jgi:hypothetical protein
MVAPRRPLPGRAIIVGLTAVAWWAERGLSLYGNDCARPEAVEDLRERAANYRARLA